MHCENLPPPSPADTEISVGSPSPPPIMGRPRSDDNNYFAQKRPKINVSNQRSNSPPSTFTSSTKSTSEGVKGFSIADILGNASNRNNKIENPQSRLQQQQNILNLTSSPFVYPWDHLRAPITTLPFLPPALLHYEHQLAYDYQRQLQEYLNAQAELLRQRITIENAHSESGSERSRSTDSDCSSPEIKARLSGSEPNLTHANYQNRRSSYSGDNRCNENESGLTKQRCEINLSGQESNLNETPLDALFHMTNKDFNKSEDQSHLDLFSTRPQPKKKRKSRTAFTNHQIFGLEKRFLYQKYLSPADRDEIAAALGLSNAQVITWFQNRRAKQKRDLEELRKDIESAQTLSTQNIYLENFNDLNFLKKKAANDTTHQEEQRPSIHPIEVDHCRDLRAPIGA